MVSPVLTNDVFSKIEVVPDLPAKKSSPEISKLNENKKRYFQSALNAVRTQVYPKSMMVAKKGIDISIDIITLTSGLSRMCLAVTKAVSSFFLSSQFVQNMVNVLKPIFAYLNLAQIVLAPLHLYNIFHSVYDLIKGEIDIKDCLLNALKSIGLLVCSITTLIRDLAYIGAIPLKFIKNLWPLDIFGIIVSGLTLISSARQWHDSAKFSKEFRAIFDSNKDISQFCEDDYIKMRDFILKQDTKRLKRITDIRGQEIIERITRICDQALHKDIEGASKEDRDKAKKDFCEAMNALQGRVKTSITSSKVSVAVASTKLVASTVLFTSTIVSLACPVTLAATPILMGTSYAAIGIAEGVGLGNFVHDFVKNKKFMSSNLMKLDLKTQVKEPDVKP